MKSIVTASRILPGSPSRSALPPARSRPGRSRSTPFASTSPKGSTTAAMTVRNDGDDAVVIQASLLSWAQDESGQDVYTPTNEALVTPPIMTIPPGGEQIVRVGLRRAGRPATGADLSALPGGGSSPAQAGVHRIAGGAARRRAGIRAAARAGHPAARVVGADRAGRRDPPERAKHRATRMCRSRTSSSSVPARASRWRTKRRSPMSWPDSAACGRCPCLRTASRRSAQFRLKALTDAGEIDTPVNVER